ncbi:Ubiquitin-conjugating enzyme family protein [Trichomonas vaginalis G3]|uniref:Ubiquitin-conjugating enzyme family protein n=1 Tax=Trichomonas vaginalis (strain ATCC PRA-98 / G3) TaxID=412133 RepID=A2D9T6_TRIV3|nr:histone ubiquitination [Trichomonas vaginalis G3]EAY22942.1 Ubiquitin-conjugating enzyme family protein [Trichomonas vaginalis G3]KAI5527306.1 histone ubiquitination [Trichomonas vaginalis G3]|eukprot:XP_001583928.1 Ubiquitin-conjugating enzyme family protein [Trichomonas vaginalis G3]
MANARRIASDYKLITTQPPDGVRLISQKSLLEWEVEIDGPKETIWENGHFRLTVNFPSEYPFKAPSVKFITKIYHPNISSTGGICLDLLIDKWLPSYNVASLLVSIRSFLDDPNPEHGLNSEALEMFRNNKDGYKRTVRQYINSYANGTQ